ncbi:HPr kinase/phosphorylase [Peribacillus sp. NPDC097675]|uniref:HPr kinase/phosphorylase n=1 Tax=Peribacillus sp. NPDC097675 TaxID=3390618 RepID=UPI003D0655DD
MQDMNIYEAFGFTFSSEFSFPELNKSERLNPKVDIVIEKDELYSLWSEQEDLINDGFIIQRNSVMFLVPGTAIFLIQGGNKIIISPLDPIKEDEIRLYTLGTCMGAILLQRKILPLHGSAVVIAGKAYAIIGDSGAGKSTLASAFIRRGYQLLTDDVVPVSLNSENVPVVTPAYPQQKLWQESLDYFGMESGNFQPIIERETKFTVPVKSHFASKSIPLAGVIELVKLETEEIKLHSMQGNLQKLNTLLTHTYRNFFLADLDLIEWHFNITAKIIDKIHLYQLGRPTSHFTVEDITVLLLKTLNREEKVYD